MTGSDLDPSTRDPTRSRSRATRANDPVAHPRRLSAAERLELLERCIAELRRSALLLDPERVCELCALRLESLSGPTETAQRADWIAECLSRAIDQARRVDLERAPQESPLGDHEDYRFLTEVFFIPFGRAAHSANAFNQLPQPTRQATLELLLHAKSVQTCLEQGIADDQESLVTRARQGLLTIMQIDEAMLVERKRGKGKGRAESEAPEEP